MYVQCPMNERYGCDGKTRVNARQGTYVNLSPSLSFSKFFFCFFLLLPASSDLREVLFDSDGPMYIKVALDLKIIIPK